MIKQAVLMLAMLAWANFAVSETIMIDGVPIEITSVDSNGTGCRPGTVTTTSTPDNTQVAILFREYRAITDDNVQVAASDCNVAIGLKVEPGFSVGIVGIDWRGSVVTASGAYVNFHREFFFSGTQGPTADTNWMDGGFENFFIEDDPAFIVYSRCGGEPLIARADTSATVIGPNSLFSLRSADVNARLLYTLRVREC